MNVDPSSVPVLDALDALDPLDPLDPLAMIVEIAQGRFSPSTLDRLTSAGQQFIANRLRTSLDHCMGLDAAAHEKRRNHIRDQALRAALQCLRRTNPAAHAGTLQAEWDKFLSRGPWQRWRADPDPPADADELHRCLFYASDFNRGDSLKVRQLRSICGNFASLKLPQTPFTVESALSQNPFDSPPSTNETTA